MFRKEVRDDRGQGAGAKEDEMNTFTIGRKRYRIVSRARFVGFITAMAVAAALICGFAFGAGVSGTEVREYESVMVSQGDTLWSIARENKPEGKTTKQFVADIRAANKDIDPGRLYVGQLVDVPKD
ncbi:MAG: LysM domain-containing protein [Clostridiales Family XIII bacterium]|jgi:hypothetical protein|nr:LysM domain-containing protein [Clostridiales Family XIII bacterium]